MSVMSDIKQLKEDLEIYRQARSKVLTGQEYTIGSRRLRRPDLAELEKQIRALEYRSAILKSGGRVKTARPVLGGVHE